MRTAAAPAGRLLALPRPGPVCPPAQAAGAPRCARQRPAARSWRRPTTSSSPAPPRVRARPGPLAPAAHLRSERRPPPPPLRRRGPRARRGVPAQRRQRGDLLALRWACAAGQPGGGGSAGWAAADPQHARCPSAPRRGGRGAGGRRAVRQVLGPEGGGGWPAAAAACWCGGCRWQQVRAAACAADRPLPRAGPGLQRGQPAAGAAAGGLCKAAAGHGRPLVGGRARRAPRHTRRRLARRAACQPARRAALARARPASQVPPLRRPPAAPQDQQRRHQRLQVQPAGRQQRRRPDQHRGDQRPGRHAVLQGGELPAAGAGGPLPQGRLVACLAGAGAAARLQRRWSCNCTRLRMPRRPSA
jgi:hypothetical protein